ncbi:CTB family bacteriocin [Alkalinema sp. FACHB-956]|uniref:CTB family bacteriocin n=1 Tax=Alkalinema sp. FACHB-956 TaxID=2692768 RepID=UPI00168355D6|nr:CTB family bacteriocin [Alkalinema sp. FACHB-956]MBD2329100.1 hypothetical protein [Alkalinema sp. FACHB-956]
MTTIQQTEISTIEYVGANGAGFSIVESSDSGIVELEDDELDTAGGGAMRFSNANFNRSRTAMSGTTFAGPDGAGSTFDLKTEDISSSSTDFMMD